MSILSHLPSHAIASGTRSPANVLLCLTGSVATVRCANVYDALLSHANIANVVIILTPSATRFPPSPPLPTTATTLTDESEWASWTILGDAVLHIDLRSWADAIVIAPLSANSLAKLAGGLCDNLVTCVARAWSIGKKPFIVAPAMNTAMWEHPLTAEHLAKVSTFGVDVVQPVEKTLACGDVGMGAMASPADIAARVSELLTHFFPPVSGTSSAKQDDVEVASFLRNEKSTP